MSDELNENGEQSGSDNRPNKNYKLSKPDNADSSHEGLTFYYSRERRLENAPKEVQDLYKEQKKSRFSIFGTLVADRPRRILFVIIVILCAAIITLTITGYLDPSHTLDGNKIVLSAINVSGETYIKITKTARNDKAYAGAIDIVVSSLKPNEQNDVFAHRIFFTMEKEEVYSFKVPYNEPELLMVLQNEKNTLQLKIKPEKLD
ncbi:MAG: hypothetical protein FWD13_00055 [Treponema sp.]|nr:hypothetical protein [Treponema sp.]